MIQKIKEFGVMSFILTVLLILIIIYGFIAYFFNLPKTEFNGFAKGFAITASIALTVTMGFFVINHIDQKFRE